MVNHPHSSDHALTREEDLVPDTTFGEAKWVTHHALSVAFISVALCVAGAFSASQLASSVFPRTDFPRVVILVDNGA
jgi:hypothetical protein